MIIDNTYFQNPQTVLITNIRNTQTENIFKLENGLNSEEIVYGNTNPTDPDDTPTIVIERAILYFSEPPADVTLPNVFDFDINVIVVARSESDADPSTEKSALAVVRVEGEFLLT